MKGTVMKKLKERFENDSFFAISVIATAAVTAAIVLKSTAKMIEATAYAYRASKL